MLDFVWIGSQVTTFAETSFSWLPGMRPAVLLQVAGWFAVVAGIGTALSWMRGLAGSTAVSPFGPVPGRFFAPTLVVASSSMPRLKAGRAIGRAAVLMVAAALFEWLTLVPRAHADPDPAPRAASVASSSCNQLPAFLRLL